MDIQGRSRSVRRNPGQAQWQSESGAGDPAIQTNPNYNKLITSEDFVQNWLKVVQSVLSFLHRIEQDDAVEPNLHS